MARLPRRRGPGRLHGGGDGDGLGLISLVRAGSGFAVTGAGGWGLRRLGGSPEAWIRACGLQRAGAVVPIACVASLGPTPQRRAGAIGGIGVLVRLGLFVASRSAAPCDELRPTM